MFNVINLIIFEHSLQILIFGKGLKLFHIHTKHLQFVPSNWFYCTAVYMPARAEKFLVGKISCGLCPGDCICSTGLRLRLPLSRAGWGRQGEEAGPQAHAWSPINR